MKDEIYQMMIDMGDTRVREKVVEKVQSGRASQTALGAHAVSEMAGVCVEPLRRFMRAKKRRSAAQEVVVGILKEFGAVKAIALGTRIMFDLAMRPMTREANIGTYRAALADEMLLEQDFVVFARDSGRSTASDAFGKFQGSRKILAMRRSAFISSGKSPGCKWERGDVLLAASTVIDIILRYSGIFQTEKVFEGTRGHHRRKMQLRIVVSQVFWDWFSEGNEALLAVCPIRAPLSEPPLDWTLDGSGGFDPDQTPQIGLVGRTRRNPKGTRVLADCPVVLRGLNTLQRTPWCVNRRLMEVFDVAYRNDWEDTGFEFSVSPKPAFTDAPYESEEHAQYRRDMRRHRQSERAYRASKLRAGRIRMMADVYSSVNPFYYVHTLDFRSRCYPAASYFQYQGCDAERGLLGFYDAKALGTDEALEWFLIHGANKWGYDKVSLAQRIQWVHDNHDRILKYAEDPYEYRGWLEADSPWQFLAWAFEYGEMRKLSDPLQFKSRVPVAMDGSNNGLQIYSLLFRDQIGAHATNCVPLEAPEDAYAAVGAVVTRKLREAAAGQRGSSKHQRWGREVLRLLERMGLDGVPREAVKRPVMTQPYGCTKYTTQRYVADWYFEWIRDKDFKSSEKPFRPNEVYAVWEWVGNLVWDSIGDVVVKAREAMEWLQEVSDIFSAEGKHMSWVTPTGFEVLQDYKARTKRRVYFRTLERISVSYWEDIEDTVARNKSRNGVAPNFIHSLDASAMWMTIEAATYRGVTHFQMIHDSFGTHAADAPALAESLREAYRDIFSQPVIDKARAAWQDQIGTKVLPAPPSPGTLNLDSLLKADYFFA